MSNKKQEFKSLTILEKIVCTMLKPFWKNPLTPLYNVVQCCHFDTEGKIFITESCKKRRYRTTVTDWPTGPSARGVPLLEIAGDSFASWRVVVKRIGSKLKKYDFCRL